MGGFLYCGKQQVAGSSTGIHRSLEALEHKRLSDGRSLSIKEVIDREDFVIYLYEKIGGKSENVYHLKNGDFILNTGTLLYNRQSGVAALRRLYSDFDPHLFEFDSLQGHFCVLLFKNRKLYVWNDYFGVYHVFTNDDQSVISSSFLAVVRQLKTKQLDTQAMYEYVCEGASYNDSTYIRGVNLLDAFSIHELGSGPRAISKKQSIEKIETDDFEERVELTVNSLVSYFHMLKNCFGNKVCSALSGGYDSRLILALIFEVGMDPFLYVYGGKQSTDVRVATHIAEAENLTIHHDSKQVGILSLDEYQRLTRDEYFYCDGHGPNGVFSNGAEYLARTVRSNAANLQLNGGGGEIFRNFWKLPNRPISIGDFIKSRFDRLPESVFRGRFDRKNYRSNLQSKVLQMLGIDHSVLTREEVERLYVFMRIKYWMGYNTSIQNVRSHALIPLTEPVFACSSFSIPFEQKEAGAFEAALIQRINPRIAAYESGYGYGFAGKPPPIAFLKNSLEINLPVTVQRLIRKCKYRFSGLNLPYYLQREYINSVVPVDCSPANEYFNVDNIREPLTLSR